MIKSIDEKRRLPVELDLTGPVGNAYALLGLAREWYDKGLSRKSKSVTREQLLEDMKSSDYEHLVKVFDLHFGHFVILYR